MCNRYRVSAKQIEIARHFGFDIDRLMPEPEPLPPPELFPKRMAWVVRQENGVRRLDAMRWGFPPPPQSRAPVTNVRNLSSPFWRSALAKPERRCLVPVTSFCEWSGDKGAKTEHWFSLPGSPIFAFAGIWRPVGADGVKAYAFLTCEPNPIVAPIHEKAMPVILLPEDYDRWLTDGYADACALASPFPSQLMAVA